MNKKLPTILEYLCLLGVYLRRHMLAGRALTPAVDRKSRAWGFRHVVALGMSALMAAPGFAVSVGVEDGQLSATEITQPFLKSYRDLGRALTRPMPAPPASGQQMADRLEKLFPLLEAAESEIPRDTFDLQAVIEKVGRDPARLFEWVRDNTYLVPYRGVLRGEAGVLMDHLGNSLDRALLLYALLRSAGQAVRLAHGELTESQASQVLDRTRSFHALAVAPAAPSSADEFIQKYADLRQLDRLRLRKAVDQLGVEQRRVRQLIQKRAELQTSMLVAALGTSPVGEGARDEAERISALRDHWWIQRQSGTVWVDLDPTLPQATAGQALTNALETALPDKLPSSLFHGLTIRILVERWEEGHVKNLPVLTHNLRSSELLGKDIVLRHVPLKWPRDLDLSHEKEPLPRFRTAVLSQDEWLPMITVGDANISQSSFLDSGETNAAPLAPLGGGAAQGLGRDIGNILGSGKIGQAGSRKPERTTYLTAEWIEYETRVPGQAVRAIRREVFDLIGPAARSKGSIPGLAMTDFKRLERGLILMGETDILPLASQLSQDFIAHLLTTNLLTNRTVVLTLLHNLDAAGTTALADYASQWKSLPLNLYSLASALRGVGLTPGDVYLDRLNIFSYHKVLRPGERGEVLRQESFDLVANDVAVRPGSAVDPFLVRLKQGVFDTNAEALLTSAGCQPLRQGRTCHELANTSELFAVAKSQRLEWLTVRTNRDPSWRKVELSKDVRARIEQDLAAHYAVVAPATAVALEGREGAGWWRIDPTTGTTLGIGDRGWGQTETFLTYTHITVSVVGFLVCVLWFGEGLANCVVAGALGLGAAALLEMQGIGVGIIILAYAIEFFLAKGFHAWDEWNCTQYGYGCAGQTGEE